MDNAGGGGGGRRRERTATKHSAEDQALDQIAKEVSELIRIVYSLYKAIVVHCYYSFIVERLPVSVGSFPIIFVD